MTTAPRRVLGLRDVVLFLVVAVVGTRWIAVAAAVGPAALTLWLIAFAAMFVPLAFAVMELSSRWPDEGGLYVWTRRAFGDFAGFLAAWMYWASNIVYFPGLLYFVASNALFVAGARGQALADSAAWHMGAALVGLVIALVPNLLGLRLGTRLHNAGAFGSWVPVAMLAVMAAACAARFGPATEFTPAALAPSNAARDLALWSSLAFAFGGLEASALMAGEIVNPRRTLPRAILIGGLIITAIYVIGTLSVLVALPASEASGLQGLMQATERAATRLGWPWATPVAAALLTLGGLGMAGAWLAATARLPFVAGIDRALPEAFGRLHPRWGTPHVALLVQGAAAALFAVLGQAGETVQGAYDALVNMCVIVYFIPFLFLFAALIRVQREPAGPEVMRVPGGAPVAIGLALLGMATTLGGIALALVPPAGATRPWLAVVKVAGASAALLAIGAWLHRAGRASRASAPAPGG